MNDIKRIVSLLKHNVTSDSSSGYIVVFLTGMEASIIDKLTGEQQKVLLFHIIGPIDNPKDEVIQVANALDSMSIPIYNIQAVEGIIDMKFMINQAEDHKLHPFPDVATYIQSMKDKAAKYKLDDDLDNALGMGNS